MTARLQGYLERIRSHILFVPGLLVVIGCVLAILLVETDRRLDPEDIREVPWIFRAGASGARDVLATVAMAMAQLAGITFSVTIVALALRSQQFGPRLLRNFTRDKMNQVVLGTFLGTFAYSLLVLRAVRDLEDPGIDDATFIPMIAVTFAIALALVSLALFVVFIDRIVSSIQASSIIAEAANETHDAIDSLFPEELGGEEGDETEEEAYEPFIDAIEVPAPKTGYIQTINTDALMERAREADVVVRMEAPIGGFVVKGTPLVLVATGGRVNRELVRGLEKVYVIGRDRSVQHDPEFGIQQIVDVAVKALSPSLNDPTTAVNATSHLGALLIDFATRSIPSRLRRDREGKLRVIAIAPSFRSMANLAFNQIREHGGDDVVVTLALLETIIRVAGAVRSEARREVLASHVWKISRAAAKKIEEPVDRAAVNERLRLAMERLGRGEDDSVYYLLPLEQPA